MTTLEEDLLCEDIESMLMNREEMSLYLKKLKESCDNFSTKIHLRVQDLISETSDFVNQVKKSNESIIQLSNKKTELKKSLESVKLEQKIVEKKTINAIKETEERKTEIENIKEMKEKISLELVDIEQEYEKTKEYMKKQWEALKKACKTYKDILDIRIDTEMINEVEHVTITFFWSENPTDKTFSLLLEYQDDVFKVKKIEPELSTEQKYQLNHVVQFSKQSEVVNIRALLPALRSLFLKNYFKK